MLRKETRDSMTSLERTENGFIAEFMFHPDFTGFKGHFPGKPVLPAICLLQASLVADKSCRGNETELKNVVSAKFFSTVSPHEKLLLKGTTGKSKNGSMTLKAYITAGDRKVADLTLEITKPKSE